MRFHRPLAALLLGLPLATPIAFAAEDAPLAPEVRRRVAVVVLARRIRGHAAMAKASSDCLVERGVFRAPGQAIMAISLEELGISRGVLANPLVVAVNRPSACWTTAVPWIQRRRLKLCSWPKTNSNLFSRWVSQGDSEKAGFYFVVE